MRPSATPVLSSPEPMLTSALATDLALSRRMRLTLSLSLMAVLLTACNEPTSKAPVPADPMLVQAGASLTSHLRVADVGTAEVSEVLRVPGNIDFDEQYLARIGASVTGRVASVDAVVGQTVHKGQVLGTLNSSELSQAQLAYLKAHSQLALHKRAAERAKLLFESDVIGSAEVQRRDSEYQISQAEARAAADQLRLLGFSTSTLERLAHHGKIAAVTPVLSTLNGVVVERHVVQGQVVEPAATLFSVADLSRLWAVAEVPERQAGHVAVGQVVRIEVSALGSEPLEARISFVSQTVNPATRTVLVRCELPNRDGRLKPEMLATMLIAARPEARTVVPAAAVVRENNIDHVFTVLADGRYRLTRVQLGPEEGGRHVVLSGLKPGQRIVVAGAFHLNNERNRVALEGK